MDRSRQRLQAERREKNISEYEKHDDRSLPAWTLLLPTVVKAYGICPYLNVDQPHHSEERGRWVSSQTDGGATYRQEVDRLINSEDREKHRLWEESALARLENIITRLGRRHQVDVAAVISQVRQERDAKTKTKKDKARYLSVMQEVDRVARETHVDLVTYLDVVDRWNIRHTLPEDTEIDTEFVEVCDAIRLERDKLNNISGEKGRQKKQAYDALSRLIDTNFLLEQQGRWCKRWFQLTSEQKNERIAVYATNWATMNGFSAEMGKRLESFVHNALQKKALTATDIHWNIQSGLIEGINVAYSSVTDDFTVEKPPSKGDKRKARPIVGADTVSTSEDRPRLNRLMLLFLVSSETVERAAALTFVQSQVGPTATPDVVGQIFDKMAEVVVSHPMR